MTADNRGEGISVFISHNHEDGEAAKTIKKKLSVYGPGRLHFFLSEEITYGKDWLKCINDNLATSNVLLLLFTDPRPKWDWCLYEAGLFTRPNQSEGGQKRHVICLHNPRTPPPPQLSHLQTVKVDLESIKTFLKQLFGSTELTGLEKPINTDFAENDDDLTRVANDLCAVIAPINPDRHGQSYPPSLTMRVKSPNSLESKQIPAETVIKSERAFELFGLDECKPSGGDWTWDDLQQNVQRAEDKVCVKELSSTLSEASLGRNNIKPIQATFQLKGGKLYRPVLHRRDLERDGSMLFEVLLVEQFSEALAEIPMPIGTLLTSLTMAAQFRWNLINHYRNLIKGWETDHDKADGCQELLQAIKNIENVAANKRFITSDLIENAFEDLEERSQVRGLYSQWEGIRLELERVLQQKNLDKLKCLLEKLKGLNTDFMVLASKRYHELLEKMTGHEDNQGSALIHAVAS